MSIGASAGAAIIPQATVGALNLVGFTSAGPAAGSVAALLQSYIGSVTAGSPFALAQSAAMGGLAAPMAITGAVVGVTFVLASHFIAKSDGGDHDEDEDDAPADDAAAALDTSIEMETKSLRR